ncbi:P-loop containing nucleoside triphosphate hydrolase protein [Globomyces pollinis-pini]|nr:P-loop containing nucleoside triphosphate hydrolase protein [Globomyces pollinis-pini]
MNFLPKYLKVQTIHKHFSTKVKSKAKKMPPKKVQTIEKPLLGRPGNNLKMGIVGLPNVGKSSFFNSITNSAMPSENFPFCTIDPAESRVAVPDPRFDWLVDFYKPKSIIPAFLTVIDIAGLVKGAAEGQGLGNAFLSHIIAVDGIFHLVRGFDDPEVIHVEGEVDPIRDVEIIHEELRLKDTEFMNKLVNSHRRDVERVGKGGNAADKDRKEAFEVMLKVQKWIGEDKRDLRDGDWSGKEIELINTWTLITAKPVVYLINLSERDYCRKKNKWLPKLKAWIDEKHPGDILIPFSGVLESNLSQLQSNEEKEEYLKSLQAKYDLPKPVTSVLPKIVVSGYSALQLQYFFTGGADEVRAWTIRKNYKAPQAAGTIHTDFEKGFIMAEVMQFADLKQHGSEAAVKSAGRYLMKGKDYLVQDGDIIYFKFGQINKGKK